MQASRQARAPDTAVDLAAFRCPVNALDAFLKLADVLKREAAFKIARRQVAAELLKFGRFQDALVFFVAYNFAQRAEDNRAHPVRIEKLEFVCHLGSLV